eukprot:TRINITY_DN15933_c0_g1_i1.p1 TRINITY_DN15933_c0_g1~~TRINITY_DN15933_c0_g1_i1.p1  ORF type:complete len:634 (+),score=140.58 TRINITY_DN15933_c0_g1_i1:73-1974(+)
MHTILASADIHGTKLNYELDFAAQPTLQEFEARANAVFGSESAGRKPAEFPSVPFSIHRMQVFNDATNGWNDLVSGAQLVDYCQVYLFQKESSWHKEVQSKIPPASKPPTATPPIAVSVPAPAPLIEIPGAGNLNLPSAVPVAASTAAVLAAQAPVSTIAAAVAEPCAFDQKLRMTFDAFGPTVDLDAFASVLHRLRIALNPQTIHDIFLKADCNQDGLLNFSEYTRLGETYPTLLDSVFYRLKDEITDKHQLDAIVTAKAVGASLAERLADVRASALQAQRERDQKNTQIAVTEQEIANCHGRERDSMAILEAATAEVGNNQNSVIVARADVARIKEAEMTRQSQLQEQLGAEEVSHSKIKSCEMEAQRAQDRLRELEKMLIDQQQEVNRQHEILAAAQSELAAIQGGKAAVIEQLREVEIQTKVAHETLHQYEAALTNSQTRERECGQIVNAVRDELTRIIATKEIQTREATTLAAREEMHCKAEAEATRACDAQAEQIQILEKENIEHSVQQRQTEDRERPLLEQEVRLRLQRENLEAEEAMLRNEHRSFNSTTHRAGIPIIYEPPSNLTVAPTPHSALPALTPTAIAPIAPVQPVQPLSSLPVSSVSPSIAALRGLSPMPRARSPQPAV